MSDNLDVMKMSLHDVLDIGLFSVLRVPHGWIYFDKANHISTYVPLNDDKKQV